MCYNKLIQRFIFLFLATYDTQSIDITSTNGEVCVVCTFSINTTAFGCEIQLRNNIVALTERFNRDVNIAEGCLSNIISGYYDLYVYDVENDHKLSVLPAIIKNQVFVDAKRTTTSITTTISTATFLKDSFSYSVPLLLSSSISLTS